MVRLVFGELHISFGARGGNLVLGCGRLGGHLVALLVGWGRWPHASLGSVQRRIGIGEWQSDPPGRIRGVGPLWMTSPPPA